MSQRVLHIVGARPNFPKAAPVVQALQAQGVAQRLVHTGQHYDERLSDVFFRQLGLPEPDLDLGVGSGTQAQQTAAVMTALEQLLSTDPPGLLVVYGDVNSTLAAALVAAKAQVPLAHVEAGLRSFDASMPEEVNRVVTDRLSDVLLATSADAVTNLEREGRDPDTVHLVGNPMIDTLLAHREELDPAQARATIGGDGDYVVATLHRPGNVDQPAAVRGLVKALHEVADQADVVLPLHPRGRATLADAGLFTHPRLRVAQPMGYVDFLALVQGAAAVVTDSGGVQEETTILGVPCLTLRPNTERPVTISHGTNQLTTAEHLPQAIAACLQQERPTSWPVPPLWDGAAGARIADVLTATLATEASTTPAGGADHAGSPQ